VWDAQSGNDTALVENLQEVSPDVICIASFPWIIHENVFSKPRLGALNVHPSLLPRHRGPNPFFWTYYHNDQQTGVTVHQVAAKLDAGDIIAQEALDVPRGVSVNILHDRVSVMGAELLAEATEALAQGNVKSRTQDVAQVTRAPKVKPGTPMTNFADWPVERVWHFLSGLCPHFIEPLQGAPYKSVTGFEEAAHSRVPGSIEKSDSGWRLFCQGGYVALSAEEKSA
jgi:methionyl-tRNA formyltransferase